MLLIPNLYNERDKNYIIYQFHNKSKNLNSIGSLNINFKNANLISLIEEISNLGYIVNIKCKDNTYKIDIIKNNILLFTYKGPDFIESLFEIVFIFAYDYVTRFL